MKRKGRYGRSRKLSHSKGYKPDTVTWIIPKKPKEQPDTTEQ